MKKMMINNNGAEYNVGHIEKIIKEEPEMFDYLEQEELEDPYIEYDNVPVEIHKISHKCPKCGKGYMQYTGQMVCTYEPYYIHKCDICGHCEDYAYRYPKYVAIDK